MLQKHRKVRCCAGHPWCCDVQSDVPSGCSKRVVSVGARAVRSLWFSLVPSGSFWFPLVPFGSLWLSFRICFLVSEFGYVSWFLTSDACSGYGVGSGVGYLSGSASASRRLSDSLWFPLDPLVPPGSLWCPWFPLYSGLF